MGYDLIIQLASEFRRALETVAAKGEYGRLSLFTHFPDGCCTYTSDLLAEYLIENGIQRERIQVLNSKASKGYDTHCWLMIDDMYYLDITGDQFSNKSYYKKYGPISNCCFVPKDTCFFERFANKSLKASCNVGINTYSGDVSEKLQIVYDATVANSEGAISEMFRCMISRHFLPVTQVSSNISKDVMISRNNLSRKKEMR